MATETFIWLPSADPQASIKFAVRTASFGDGYEQTVKSGLNSKKSEWPLSFWVRGAEAVEIIGFLDRHAGAKSFYWQPPLAPAPLLFKVDEYNHSPGQGDNHTITATFKQSFQP